ncbi:hypothetical protein A9R16_008710 [Acidiferrobacter thiooxydans]|nr:hypothetical protein [Acidiferrobacter thiooxydans]MDA8190557.1 hypothetical protein [Gammaproteobacteria bacterium]UEN98523.1 hypothetical protein A9R16_008710 [Acidiferrobacter thiooxydans]
MSDAYCYWLRRDGHAIRAQHPILWINEMLAYCVYAFGDVRVEFVAGMS